jgi:signal peptidase II
MKNFVLIVTLFFIDQLSKTLVVNVIPLNESFDINNFLNIVLIYNKGFLLGYLSGLQEGLLFFIHFLVFFASIYIIYKFLYLDPRNKKVSLLFFSGALGNSYDRFFREGVVDFIDLHYHGIHWPAFNVADSMIFIGVVVYLIKYMNGEKVVYRNS